MPKPKSSAARRAMAERGTFKPDGNSSYGKPYTAAVSAAVTPFNEQLKRAQIVWGQRLLKCVPPSYAASYAQLVADMDKAMMVDDAKTTAQIAGRLCKALAVMHKSAIDAGHKPDDRDIVTALVDGQVYAFVLRGDLGLIRREHPDWVVYAIEDAVYSMRGRLGEIMQETARHFENVVIRDVRREIVDDEINL